MSQSSNNKLEKDYEGGVEQNDFHLPLSKSITLSSEQFERLYLGPKTKVEGNLRKTFANPTPIALLGFSVGLTPLSIAYMGWRGSGGNAVATTTASFFFGGMCLILGGIGEFLLGIGSLIPEKGLRKTYTRFVTLGLLRFARRVLISIGNSFPTMVFIGYGSHFLTIATLFIPWFNAAGFYTTTGDGSPLEGSSSPEFLASFAYYLVSLCLLSIIFLLGSLRTNLVFVVIFVLASIGFGCAAGGFFRLSEGNTVVGSRLIVGTGACFFGASVLGWYLTLASTIAMMELPIPDLPIFDLTSVIKARPRTKEE